MPINKPSQPLVPAEIDPAVLDGKADLVNGEVPADQLPSYVDDVLEFADVEHFPAEGEEGKIYVALDNNYTYRWSGSAYVQIGGGEMTDYYTKPEADALLANKADNFVYHVDFDPATSETGHQFIGAMSDEDYERLMSDPEHALIAVNDIGGNISYILPMMTRVPVAEGMELPLYGLSSPEGEVIAWSVRPDKNWVGQKQDPASYATVAMLNQGLAGKQDVINDLSTIRSGAAAGATAVQPAVLNAYYTSAEVDSAIAAAVGNVLNEEF